MGPAARLPWKNRNAAMFHASRNSMSYTSGLDGRQGDRWRQCARLRGEFPLEWRPALGPRRGDQVAQPPPLPPLGIEIIGRQPLLHAAAHGRPFAVDDREPGGVAVAALVDDSLAENAFELEAEPRRGRARRRVEAVALPFVAPVAQVVEGAPHQQVLRLGGRGGALELFRIHHMADFDHAVGGVDAHGRQRADRAAAARLDDGVVLRVLGGLHLARVGLETVPVGKRAGVGVGPVAVVGRLAECRVQVVAVARRVHRLQPAVVPGQGLARRAGTGGPVGYGLAYGLLRHGDGGHADDPLFTDGWETTYSLR